MFSVHMRGLPFRVTENEIAEWFSSVADPVDVFIHYNNDGRLESLISIPASHLFVSGRVERLT